MSEPKPMPPRRKPASGTRPRAVPDAARWVKPMPVRDWMHREPVVVRGDLPIVAAVELLRARHIRHLPVVDDRGRLIGIATDRDLRQVVLDPRIVQAPGEVTLTLAAIDTLLGARVTTIRPLDAAPGDAAAYDYGYAIPDDGDRMPGEGIVD